MELIKKHIREGANFKDILWREVLEYIVKGFEHMFFTKEEPVTIKDHFGFILKGEEKAEEKKEPTWF